jgi:hypothetical protein
MRTNGGRAFIIECRKGQLPIDNVKKKTVKYVSCVSIFKGIARPAEYTIQNRNCGARASFFHTGASFDAF